MEIFQKQITINGKSRGYHIITDEILAEMPQMKDFRSGLAHIFINHTSASLTINENADPSVRRDFETFFNDLVPEDMSKYEHTAEGPDDMTSHIKSTIQGSSVTVPVTDGKFNMGTWQGIFLCEHRNSIRRRKLTITIIGERYG